MPIVAEVRPDATIIETIYDPIEGATSFAVCDPEGHIAVLPAFDLPDGRRLVPYSASNNLLTSGCVLLPSGVGEVGDVGELVADIRRYIARYVDVSAEFLALAPYYVLLSWVYDAFKEVPYLRLLGAWGSGKTRGLLTIGSICYTPFFASGASTVSPIFHILDRFRGTLVLDEADLRWSDTTNELVKILNNGTVDGLPVLRTMTNRHRELNPQAFRVFGPKLLAMRESFQDDALESRFITESTARRALPTGIPLHTPDTLAIEARSLRNRLLGYRLRYRHAVGPDGARAISGVDARTNQMALPLLSLIEDNEECARIAAWLAGLSGARDEARGQLPEALVLAAVVDAFSHETGPYVSIADIARRFNDASIALGRSPMTNKWVGGVVRQAFGLMTSKSNGVYGIPRAQWARVQKLAAARVVPARFDLPS
ncbi:hypothetical protein [Sphingomonas sp.]|uniref:hypothetical protein n=1 Tax=Sphingomonas sp. TaxID=28214 RepID=UPI001B10CFD5|nr:hypothetical protein [Sphingomonas sp.]MBO9714260.1 hypothetical protein [Sphingomonas sp.]